MDLSNFFTTKLQAQDFFTRLSSVVEKLYSTNFNFEKEFAEQFGIQKKDNFIILLHDNKLTTEPTPALKEFLNQLLTDISQMPVISLKIAFEARDETLHALSEWFSLNLKKQVLFDIAIDRTLIAGAAIFYQGTYADFSIKVIFDRVLKETVTPPHSSSNPEKPVQISPAHHSTEHMTIGR